MSEVKKNAEVVETVIAADATAPDSATAQADGLNAEEAASETEIVPLDKKRRLLYVGIVAAILVLVAVIAILIGSGLNRLSSGIANRSAAGHAAVPAVNVQATSQGTTVVVPAVRGVDATGCQETDLAVEGNRLVFKNGCAKPVFYGQSQ